MRRKIVFSLAAFFLVLGVLAVGYRHLASSGNAGYVIIGLGDWVLETSLYFVVIVLTVLFLGLYFGIRFMTGAAKLPESIKKRNTEQRGKRSLEALVDGVIETLEGKWEKAERNLIRHAADSSLPLINYLTAARAAHARGAPEQREDYLKLASASVPQAELATGITRAELLVGTRQFQEAIEQLTILNKITPNHPVILRLMFEAYRQTRDFDALHHLIPVLRESKLVAESDLRPLEVETYRVLLEKRALTHDPTLIREIWRQVPAQVRSEAVVQMPYCEGMIDAGVGEEVEEELRLALGRDWNPILLALYARIEAVDAARQLSSAEEWLGPHQDDARLLQVLAKFALKAGQTEKAQDYLQRSLALEPTLEACKLMGDQFFAARNFQAASTLYRQGLKIATGEPLDPEEATLARNPPVPGYAQQPA
ncbi:MAG: heme biosynthesis protein HemY [Methylococcaceae bacterium]|nr:heme biosynthesis protein HemY [Methylococcaceae bacterium]